MGVELPGPGPGDPKRLDADPQLVLELKVAAKYGKFHSEFLAYSQDDRDKAIWQYLWEHSECPHCGTRSDEWNEETGGHRHAYVAEFVQCEGCVVKLKAEEDPQMREFRGMRVRLVRNEVAG